MLYAYAFSVEFILAKICVYTHEYTPERILLLLLLLLLSHFSCF